MKNANIVALLALFVLSSIFLGCSGAGNPVAPQEISPVAERVSADDTHGIMATFRVEFDPASGEASVIPLRLTDAHCNVTAFTLPPNCNDCVQIIGSNYTPANEEWSIVVKLKNPAVPAYDVRGLVYNLGTKYLKNPDGFMNQYIGQDMDFRAYGKDNPLRVFWPGTFLSETFLFHFPAGSNWNSVDYIIDASWPGNCKEPMIEDITHAPTFVNGINPSVITAKIFDHQDDLLITIVDLTSVGGELTPMFDDGYHSDGVAGDGVFGADNFTIAAIPGMHRINLFAYDWPYHYGWSSFHVEILGGPNDPPDIDSLSMTRTTCYKGSATEKITFKCNASDPDHDVLHYYWSCDGGDFEYDIDDTAVWLPPNTVGKYYVTCEVSDNKGGIDSMQSGKIRVTKYEAANPAAAPGFQCERQLEPTYFFLSNYSPGNVILLNFWRVT